MVRCLSFHAQYRCRRSGACCTSNWPIPIEADRLVRLQAAIATGAVRPAVSTPEWLIASPDAPPDTPGILATAHGRCVFFEAEGHHACRIHAFLGHDALPLACRQFPRIALHDPRGVSVTLSHYCPTAMSWLASAEPVTIVEQPDAFAVGADYDGLDATRALPPLLRDDMLMDWHAWWAWETSSVLQLTDAGDADVSVRLSRLRCALDHIRDWSPAQGPLIAHVDHAFAAARRATVMSFDPDRDELELRWQEIAGAIPEDLQSEAPRPADRRGVSAPALPAHVDRFLAAHAFANWTAHLGAGLHAWLRSVEAPYVCLLRGLDIRQTDLMLRHLASPNALAKTWSAADHRHGGANL